MTMQSGIDLKGMGQILAGFDFQETPYFAVYQGRDLKFQCLENNSEVARDILAQNLAVLETNQNTSPFKIVFYYDLDKAGKLAKANEKGSNTFRVCEPMGTGGQMVAGAGGGHVAALMQEVRELKEVVQQRFEQEEEEEESPTAHQGIGGVVGALLQNPEVQSALIGRVLSFLDQILPPATPKQVGAIAGIGEAVSGSNPYLEAIKDLEAAGMSLEDLRKLATLARTNGPMFNLLLSQLRGMAV